MSRYAYDPARRAVVVSWATGTGDLAATVATLPTATAGSDALRLAEQLTFLAAAAWRTYAHPASATVSFSNAVRVFRQSDFRHPTCRKSAPSRQ